jgi:predicted helicase
MRQSLLNSFNRIYILNLHGNALKKEKAPDGSKDENVFEIKTGVAISVFIKNAKYTDKKIFYADVWGDRELKYNWLDRHTLNNTPWEELKPESPNYFFSPQNTSSSDEYGQYLSITDIFPVFSIGIVTARDSLTIQPTPTEIWNTVQKFSALDAEEARVIYSLGKDARDWKIELAQKDLKNNNGPTKENITQILYRPFDFRYTYYTGNSRGFHCMPRNEVMKNMLKDNMCLITRRQMLPPYGYFFVSNRLVSDGAIRSDNRGGESVFPLYLYSEKDGVVQKETNIPQSILKKLSACIGEIVSPEKLLHYIYGVFFSTAYRTKFADFLKSDYPRVPIVNDSQLFRVVAEIGEELVNLHLMKTTLSSNIAFNVQGSNVVESINYFENKVYINKTQFFEGIPADAWAFTIGAYQVLEKWLKSRKNKQLAGEEIEQFIQIVEIAKRTLLLMRRLDEIPFLDAPVVDAKQLLPD